MNKKESKAFWAMVAKNKEEVKKMPKWMQKITINAKTIASGEYYD